MSLDDITDPQTSVVLTTGFKNPRIKEVTLDTSGDTPLLEGTFAIDVENTGFFATRSTRVIRANITLKKDNTSLNIGKIEEPVPIQPIPAGETRTISIGFSRQSRLVNLILDDVCKEQTVTADMNITVAEIILAATYDNELDIEIQEKECTTIALDISGQQQVNIDQGYEWNVSAISGEELPEVNWSMGDGTSKSGTRVNHTYTTPGTYEIQAETPAGISTTYEVVAESIPLGIVGNNEVTVNNELSWRVTGSRVDEVGELSWDMGDGTTYSGQSVSHTYTNSGTFNINLTSETGESASLEVTSEFPNIDLTITGETEVIVGESNTWTASGTNIPEAEEIRWSMGDATEKSGTEVDHSYQEGTYEIRAAAVISDTEIATDTLEVISSFTDISVDIAGGDTREAQQGNELAFNAIGDNIGAASEIKWSMGDPSGTTYTGQEITHTYSERSGEFDVTVEAKIDGNLISTDTQTVTVQTFLI